jgi:hypothetical protein
MTTAAERQENYRARMRARGYIQQCEWIPAADAPMFKELAAGFRKAYADQGEPDRRKK